MEKEMFFDYTKYMENNNLSMAMAAYRSNSSDENLGILYQELLDAEYVVPVLFEGETQISQVRNDTRVNLFTMKNNQGDRYYLVFSAIQEMKDWQVNVPKNTIALNFTDLVNLLEKSPNVKGILIDPLSGNMVFEKELMFTLSEFDSQPSAFS